MDAARRGIAGVGSADVAIVAVNGLSEVACAVYAAVLGASILVITVCILCAEDDLDDAVWPDAIAAHTTCSGIADVVPKAGGVAAARRAIDHRVEFAGEVRGFAGVPIVESGGVERLTTSPPERSGW